MTLAGLSHAADNRVFPDGLIERYANWLPYKAYTPDNELNPLPSASANSAHQDPHGYMWLSVYSSALLRYDGHHMESYGLKDGLPSVHLEGSLIGQDGHLWITTHSGLAISSSPIIEYEADERVEFTTTWDGEKLLSTQLRVPPVQVGEWVGVYTQAEERVILYRLSSGNGGGLERQDFEAPISQFGVGRVILSVSADTFLLGSDKGVFQFDMTTKEVRYFPGFLDCTGVWALHQDSTRQAWAACQDGRVVRRPNWFDKADEQVIIRGSSQRLTASRRAGRPDLLW